VPDTAPGHQFAWVLSALAQPPSETDVATHLSPAFLSDVPAPQVVALLTKLDGDFAPFTLEGVEPGATDTTLRAIVVSSKPGAVDHGGRIRVVLGLDPATPGRIGTLMLRPAFDKPASSWGDVEATVRAVAPAVSFLAADIVDGKCSSVSAVDADKPRALGSTFKLYVLDALARQIAAGKRKWDDTVAIQDRWKSLPPGDLRKAAAGTKVTLRELAEKMISVSDSTATDHVIGTLGRPVVEAAVKASGHASPALLVPFLTTRDVFALKLLDSPEELHAFATADVAHKKKLLEAVEKRDLDAAVPQGADGWTKPRAIDTVEWLASSVDLCNLLVDLKRLADLPATSAVGAILSMNPGVPDDASAFKYIAFKGGSEPGVMNVTWLVQRAKDDKWGVVTVGWNDASDPIDERKAIGAAAMARAFYGR
jgi:hypothetical protein